MEAIMNITVSLTPELNELVNAKVKSGRYTSPSEVMRDALRMLERADQSEADEIEYLRKAWDDGEASGIAEPFDMEKIMQEGRKRLLASSMQN
jgi:antitoxin ParD1/3/4